VFEPNDKFTWRRFINLVEPYLRSVANRRGVYDFKVVCDETTNTPVLIDQNQMSGKIYIKPTKAAEMIVIDFMVMSTGASFTENV
jgi:phage tail sheath protein FI